MLCSVRPWQMGVEIELCSSEGEADRTALEGEMDMKISIQEWDVTGRESKMADGNSHNPSLDPNVKDKYLPSVSPRCVESQSTAEFPLLLF